MGLAGMGEGGACGVTKPFDPESLDRMAEAGGVPRPSPSPRKYYDVSDHATFRAALEEITGKIFGGTVGGCVPGGRPGDGGASGGAGGGGSGGGGAGGPGQDGGVADGANADGRTPGGVGHDGTVAGCACRVPAAADGGRVPFGILVLGLCGLGTMRRRRRR